MATSYLACQESKANLDPACQVVAEVYYLACQGVLDSAYQESKVIRYLDDRDLAKSCQEAHSEARARWDAKLSEVATRPMVGTVGHCQGPMARQGVPDPDVPHPEGNYRVDHPKRCLENLLRKA